MREAYLSKCQCSRFLVTKIPIGLNRTTTINLAPNLRLNKGMNREQPRATGDLNYRPFAAGQHVCGWPKMTDDEQARLWLHIEPTFN